MTFVVTKHSRERFTQRYKLLFHKSYFYKESLTNSLILSLIENGTRISWWENVLFYKNKVESVYGPTIAYQTKACVFICTPLPNGKVIIRTCVKAFDPRFNIKI